MTIMKNNLNFGQQVALIENGATFKALTPSEKIKTLTDVINYADWSYYVKDEAILADSTYDAYFKKLQQIEAIHPNYRLPHSPTQRVAYGISKKLETVQHLVPMLSLDNSYNEEDLKDWDERNKKSYKGSIEYTAEPKYDGASISLIYENDQLVRGATRGDGNHGENITSNVKMIRNIPLHIPLSQYGIQSIEIRGEVIIPNKAFEQVNEQRVSQGLAILANPRNAASGSLRILDAAEVAKRKLSAILYHIAYYTLLPNATKPAFLDTHFGMTQWLDTIGFATSLKSMKHSNNILEILDYCHQYETQRDHLGFEIDGMVLKVNEVAIQDDLGMTAHHPRWAMAYKFKARQATAKLLEVQFQVGRTGTITPVAKIEPVYIGGVTVSSISLFNEDVIHEKDIKIGDSVIVERAGDVIPYIVKSIPELRSGIEMPIIFPHSCPVCHQEIIKSEGEAAYKCINWNCEAQIVERLIHFASKDAMDIRNLGDANIKRFYELGILHSLEDIYRLPYEQLEHLEKLGKKSIENLQTAIENSKNQPLNRILYGLGIRFVGETTAKTLARKIADIRDLKEWNMEQLLELDDIGPKVAQSVYDFFHDDKHIAMLHELEILGVKIHQPKSQKATTSGNLQFDGKTFLFTGTLHQFKRNDAEAKVELLGGKILSGVSSKLDYLVVGEAAGSKLEKAKKIGTVTILTENEFINLINPS
jgi:DNA ligase (NAD+)